MSDVSAAHERLEPLAAAYVLDALEAEEESAFQAHLASCALCQVQVAELLETAADLAEATSGPEPSPALRARILAAALSEPREAASAPVRDLSLPAGDKTAPGLVKLVDLDARRLRKTRAGRPRRWRVAAIAAALLVVGGIAGGLLASSRGIGQPPSRCGPGTGCEEVTLMSDLTHRPAATVMVSQGSVWLKPEDMRADDTADRIYVLWEIADGRGPQAVGAFDVHPGRRQPIGIGTLPTRAGVSAFAVSLEPGRRIPAAPSDIVAVGHPA
jgi:anti-sigma-K factor RskA